MLRAVFVKIIMANNKRAYVDNWDWFQYTHTLIAQLHKRQLYITVILMRDNLFSAVHDFTDYFTVDA